MHGHFRTLHINTSEASPFFFLIIIPLAILSSTVDSFNVYTDQPVPAHSRLVYRLGVINLIHAYPGTYVFCFCSHHLRARDKKPGKCRSNRCEKRRRHPMEHAPMSRRRVEHACAFGREHRSWPLTSAAYNRNCLDQTHTAHKTLPTRLSQTTPLRYLSQSQLPRLQPFRQRQVSLTQKQRVLRQPRTKKSPNLTAIGFVRN